MLCCAVQVSSGDHTSYFNRSLHERGLPVTLPGGRGGGPGRRPAAHHDFAAPEPGAPAPVGGAVGPPGGRRQDPGRTRVLPAPRSALATPRPLAGRAPCPYPPSVRDAPPTCCRPCPGTGA